MKYFKEYVCKHYDFVRIYVYLLSSNPVQLDYRCTQMQLNVNFKLHEDRSIVVRALVVRRDIG